MANSLNGDPVPDTGREGAGNPRPAADTSPGAQGSSSAGGPKPDDRPKVPQARGAPGAAGSEIARLAGRTNWPDDPDRYRYANLQSASGHRPPTLAKDPTAPVYIPGDPNSLVPGEVSSTGQEVNPPPTPLPEAGDDYYQVRPEPALDDIPRDARHARTQEAAALEQANVEYDQEIITREGGEYLTGAPGLGELDAEALGEIENPQGSQRQSRAKTSGAKPYRPAGKAVKRPVE